MKLYYSTGSCSTSCHIAFEEMGLNYTPVEVSWDRNLNVEELEKLNPLGVAPVLVNEKGEVLTQNVAILEYAADMRPASRLLAEKGSWQRAQTLSWLSFVAADFHKAFAPLFRVETMASTEAARAEIVAHAKKDIQGYLTHIDTNLQGKEFITGKDFTIADCYLFIVTGWCQWMDISIAPYKNVSAYMARVAERPAVKKVMSQEK